MRELKARIDDGRLGTIAHCYAEQNGPAGLFMDPDSWRAEASEAPAGGMTAMGVHNLDAMIHLFGRIDEVYATSIRRAVAYDAEDTTSAMFGFANGMSGTLLTSLVTAVTYRLAVFGTKGCAELLTPQFDFRFSPTPSAPPTGRNVAAEPEIIQNRGFNTLLAELEAFAAAIRGEAPYPITAEEVLHGVAVFEAIIRSAATRQPVRVGRE
jgi:predicted dehydrogenase